MSETNQKIPFDLSKTITSLALILCCLCLALIAIGLRPIAKWANYQDICIVQESEKAPISWAVRKCNGRSKVYEVKSS